jgi:hypothetical protein
MALNGGVRPKLTGHISRQRHTHVPPEPPPPESLREFRRIWRSSGMAAAWSTVTPGIMNA